MANILALDDTIAALATAQGAAGLAVIRVSGSAALRIAGAAFAGRIALADARSHTLHHGWAVWPSLEAGRGDGSPGSNGHRRSSQRLDEVVAAVFRSPRSYTREDVVELSCHGGEQSSSRVLAALIAAGARPARPGEFTLRAFLNGRLDLTQAEAVADLIQASTTRAHELALAQLAGGLSRRLKAIAERIADATAEVEARVDFAEDVGGVEVPPHVVTAIAEAEAELARWLAGSDLARALREGARVPIVGRPNAGKSSLFNALVGEPRAIVTEIPGTTRDRVSESLELEGIRLTLSDTAGLRESDDPVERLGIARTAEAIEDAALVIWVLDRSEPLTESDRAIARRLEGRRVLAALNKSDLAPAWPASEARRLGAASAAAVSAARGEGLDELRSGLAGLLGAGKSSVAEVAVGNPRQLEALTRARTALRRAAGTAGAGEPGEIVALELRAALAAIGEVTGTAVGEDLLERIFGRFCIGK